MDTNSLFVEYVKGKRVVDLEIVEDVGEAVASSSIVLFEDEVSVVWNLVGSAMEFVVLVPVWADDGLIAEAVKTVGDVIAHLLEFLSVMVLEQEL